MEDGGKCAPVKVWVLEHYTNEARSGTALNIPRSDSMKEKSLCHLIAGGGE